MPRILRYTSLETPVGRLYVAYADEMPRLISADGEKIFVARVRTVYAMPPVRHDDAPSGMLRAILATLLGPCPYSGPLELSCLTSFQRDALARTTQIPRGEVRSYAWLARELGRPQAWRAVGTALARNPLPFVIPCHRVIRVDGRIGAYSGGGKGTKERLLTFEGVDLSRQGAFRRGNHRGEHRVPVP